MRYAVVDEGVVRSVVEWDGKTFRQMPEPQARPNSAYLYKLPVGDRDWVGTAEADLPKPKPDEPNVPLYIPPGSDLKEPMTTAIPYKPVEPKKAEKAAAKAAHKDAVENKDDDFRGSFASDKPAAVKPKDDWAPFGKSKAK